MKRMCIITALCTALSLQGAATTFSLLRPWTWCGKGAEQQLAIAPTTMAASTVVRVQSPAIHASQSEQKLQQATGVIMPATAVAQWSRTKDLKSFLNLNAMIRTFFKDQSDNNSESDDEEPEYARAVCFRCLNDNKCTCRVPNAASSSTPLAAKVRLPLFLKSDSDSD